MSNTENTLKLVVTLVLLFVWVLAVGRRAGTIDGRILILSIFVLIILIAAARIAVSVYCSNKK